MGSPYRAADAPARPRAPRPRRTQHINLGSNTPAAQEQWHAARTRREELHYNAARTSEYRHDVGGLGGTADAHYAWGMDLWRIRELVRELDRNDPLLGQLVDRGLDNILGAGLVVDPQTGDEDLNTILGDLWKDWADNPDACDYSGKFTIDEMERLGLRHAWIDGDCFVLLDDKTRKIRLEEGDRFVSGSYSGRPNVIEGVVLEDGSNRPLQYLFAKLRPMERKYNFSLAARSTMEMVELPAGSVIHVYFPKRVTQTRGVSAFAPVIGEVSLVQDVEFARLVKLQVSSCIAGFISSENPNTFNFGGTQDETSDFDNTTNLEFGEMTPGMIGRLLAGDKFTGFSPGVISKDEGEFVESLIRRVGLAIGLPIEIALLTTKETSFSGFRGVVEQYKITARVIQARYKRLFRSRVYRWKVQQWVDDGLVPNVPTIFKHSILTPTWAYIDPEKDARADATRISEGLASPRQVWSERGRDYGDGIKEMAEDAAAYITALDEAAQATGVEGLTWRDLVGGGFNPGAGAPPPRPEAGGADADGNPIPAGGGRADGRVDTRTRHDQADKPAGTKKAAVGTRDRSAEERDRKKEQRGDHRAQERQTGAKTAEERGVIRPKKGASTEGSKGKKE